MKHWIVIAVLVIGLVVCGVSWVNTGASLSATRASLRETETELSTTMTTLQEVETELSITKATLLEREAQFYVTGMTLQKTEADLGAALAEAAFWESVATPEPFGSLEELEDWLAEDDTDDNEYIDGNFDCEDFALMLQQHAREDGYKIDFQVIYCDDMGYDEDGDLYFRYEYYYWPGFPELDFAYYHAMNTTTIDNSVYVVEPQTDEVLLWTILD